MCVLIFELANGSAKSTEIKKKSILKHIKIFVNA